LEKGEIDIIIQQVTTITIEFPLPLRNNYILKSLNHIVFDRIIRGAKERLAPILMTTMTTVLALLPIIIGGNRPGQEIEHLNISRRIMMQVQVQKWGNSLALRIPKSSANQIKIEQGSYVDLSTVEGKLIAKPLEQQEYSLDQLLAGITDQNIHAEFDLK